MDYFALNIKLLRLRKGFTQTELCDSIGFQRSTWSGYEHGWSKPNFKDLLKIVEYFDVTATELLQMDLSELNLNDILEFRKMTKKLNPKLNLSLNLNTENTPKDTNVNGGKKAVDPVVLEQLNRMEDELMKLRKKLG